MLRVGTDVVDVSEVAGSLQRLGDRYARRVFSEDELAVWRQDGATSRAATDLAERFAGKEAAIKVLAPGERGLDWRCIEVRRHQRGGCWLCLSGTAVDLAHEAGISGISLSVASAAGVAMAVAVASPRLSFHRTASGGYETENVKDGER
ncbi:MAG: holo-ACP synthase [Acidimicrobiales bacterium]